MRSMDLYNDLFNHMHWADARTWQEVLNMPRAENDDRLRKIYHHYHITQYAFYHLWKELPMEFPELSAFKTLNNMCTWASKFPELAKNYFSGLKEEDLSMVINIPWAKRIEKAIGKPPKDTTLTETILQVSSHSAHHRGQVNSRIRELGGEPPLIDFIAWIWLGKPAASWPVEEE